MMILVKKRNLSEDIVDDENIQENSVEEDESKVKTNK